MARGGEQALEAVDPRLRIAEARPQLTLRASELRRGGRVGLAEGGAGKAGVLAPEIGVGALEALVLPLQLGVGMLQLGHATGTIGTAPIAGRASGSRALDLYGIAGSQSHSISSPRVSARISS